MATSWFGRTAFLLFLLGVVVQAESEVKQSVGGTKDDQHHSVGSRSKNSETRSGPLAKPLESQRKKRMTAEEEDESVDPSTYLQVLSSIDDEKRAKSSFRGDLGKRMLAMSRPLAEDQRYPAVPFSWLPGKRIKVSSRFRGDLGKRARSSFRGDLGKRRLNDPSSFDAVDDSIPPLQPNDYRNDNFKYNGDETDLKDGVSFGSRAEELDKQEPHSLPQWRGF